MTDDEILSMLAIDFYKTGSALSFIAAFHLLKKHRFTDDDAVELLQELYGAVSEEYGC